VKVLRLVLGDQVGLVDGKGAFAQGRLVELKGRAVRVKVEKAGVSDARSGLRLCFAIPKGQALDFIFRRATELGLESFQPLQTLHSAPSKGWNADRWQAVVAEVCKQCQEPFFPDVLVPQTLTHWLQSRDPSRPLYLCDEEARLERLPEKRTEKVDLLVGAEGGFSREEIAALEQAGAQFLGLGRNRLRAETAALVAMVLVKREIGEI
jgi:16S rRNA (uracil1498-N3)-methyltransferase